MCDVFFCVCCPCVADSTGTHSLYTRYQDYEIMFHVSTMLPYTSNNTQQVQNKTHIYFTRDLMYDSLLLSFVYLQYQFHRLEFTELLLLHCLFLKIYQSWYNRSIPISVQTVMFFLILKKMSLFCKKHDIKILPPSVHSHQEGFHSRLTADVISLCAV